MGVFPCILSTFPIDFPCRCSSSNNFKLPSIWLVYACNYRRLSVEPPLLHHPNPLRLPPLGMGPTYRIPPLWKAPCPLHGSLMPLLVHTKLHDISIMWFCKHLICTHTDMICVCVFLFVCVNVWMCVWARSEWSWAQLVDFISPRTLRKSIDKFPE